MWSYTLPQGTKPVSGSARPAFRAGDIAGTVMNTSVTQKSLADLPTQIANDKGRYHS